MLVFCKYLFKITLSSCHDQSHYPTDQLKYLKYPYSTGIRAKIIVCNLFEDYWPTFGSNTEFATNAGK